MAGSRLTAFGNRKSWLTTIFIYCSIHTRVNAAVAQLIYGATNKAGLSQAEMAKRVGTKQSVISRLEDADYEGHSLTMLQRIAAALGQCVEIRFLAPEKVVRGSRSNTAILESAA
jgi:ribosome-binding protein aMBF1 (putative translation factor)